MDVPDSGPIQAEDVLSVYVVNDNKLYAARCRRRNQLESKVT